MSDDELPEHLAVWERLRRVFGAAAARDQPGRDARRRALNAEDETTVPFAPGRDPRGLDAVLDRLTREMGWESPMAKSELLAEWSDIVGADTARHAHPIGIEEGVLTVRCDSTAWATQMRRMRSTVIARISDRHAAAGVESVDFIGPDTPSWKRGPRTVPGRGPRDTYG